MNIKKLPEDIQSFIRTGINLTSISQFVSELVLNSLDAGATRVGVRVDLKKYQLQVVDDGTGLNKEQLNLIGNRYMTSKCGSMTDLKKNLNFFGFRGEAIASMKEACDTLLIFSKPIDENVTYSRVMKRDEKESVSASKAQLDRCGHGTTVVIMNVFGNLPVRQKRLHHSIELEQIKCDLEAIALIHPQVNFTLRNDVTKVVLLQTKSCADIVQNFHQIFNVEDVSKELIYVSKTEGKFKISGYISRHVVKSKKYQFVYINKRFIYKNRIHQFVNNKLKNSLYLRSISVKNNPSIHDNYAADNSNLNYSIFIINIECPCSEYDICFDPKKNVVEFKNWDVLFHCLHKCITEFLQLEDNFQGDCNLGEYFKGSREVLQDLVPETVDAREKINKESFVMKDVTNVKSSVADNNVVASLLLVGTPGDPVKSVVDDLTPFSTSKHSVAHSEHMLTECQECSTRPRMDHVVCTPIPNKRTIIPVACNDFYENNLKLLKSNIYGFQISNNKTLPYCATPKNNISKYTNRNTPIKEYRKQKIWKENSSKATTFNTRGKFKNDSRASLLNKYESRTYEKRDIIRKSILKSPTTNTNHGNTSKKKVSLKESAFVLFDDVDLSNEYKQVDLNDRKSIHFNDNKREFHEKRNVSSYDSNLIKSFEENGGNAVMFQCSNYVSDTLETPGFVANISRDQYIFNNWISTSESINKLKATLDKDEETFSEISSQQIGEKDLVCSTSNLCNQIMNNNNGINETNLHLMNNDLKVDVGDSSFNVNCVFELVNHLKTLSLNEIDTLENSRDDMFADYSVADLISPPVDIVDHDFIDQEDDIQTVGDITQNKRISTQCVLDIVVSDESQCNKNTLEKDETNVNDNSCKNSGDNLAFIYGLNLKCAASKEMNRKICSYVNETATIESDVKSVDIDKEVNDNAENIVTDLNMSVGDSASFESNATLRVLSKRKLHLLANGTEENKCKKVSFGLIDNVPTDDEASLRLSNLNNDPRIDNETPDKYNNIGTNDQLNLTVGWTKHRLSSGGSVYIHDDSGMSTHKPPKPSVQCNLTSRLSFLPKGTSPLQDCLLPESKTMNKDNYHLSKEAKDGVFSVISDVDKNYHDNVTSLTKWKYQQTTSDDNHLGQLNTTIKKVPAIGSSVSLNDLHSFEKDDLSKAQIVGLLDNKFIIATMVSTGQKFIVVFDQHAVDERIRYETLYREYKIGDVFASKSITQSLLLTFTENEIQIINDFNEKFEEVGLQLLVTKDKKVKVGAVPTCLYKRAEKESSSRINNKLVELTKQLICEQLESIVKTGGAGLSVPQTIDSIISYEACRGAVKFGDKLILATASEMMKQLSECAMPFQCAHGRPVLAPIFNLG